MEDTQEDRLVVHCFYLCSSSALLMLGDLGLSTSMERDLVSLSGACLLWCVIFLSYCGIYSIICSYRSIGATVISDRAAVKLRDRLILCRVKQWL